MPLLLASRLSFLAFVVYVCCLGLFCGVDLVCWIFRLAGAALFLQL